MVRYIKRDCTD